MKKLLLTVKQTLRAWLKRKLSLEMCKVTDISFVPEIGKEYVLAEVEGPCFVYSFINLENLRAGDEIEIIEDLFLGSEAPFQISRFGPQDRTPIWSFPELFIPTKYRIRLFQTRGLPKKLHFVLWKRIC